MYEASKAMKRRFNDGNFFKYFKGIGVDIGAGPDCIDRYSKVFGFDGAYNWDLKDGDAQEMKSVADGTYDFVHSSHCLEHMVDPRTAVKNWVRVCKPGGYVVITIPDETMYEKNMWPSQYNSDHKWSFTMGAKTLPKSLNIFEFLLKVNDVEIVKVERIEEFYYPSIQDLTLEPNPECAIEVILRKK
jgi:predicted SAM-dependent methyltransferase